MPGRGKRNEVDSGPLDVWRWRRQRLILCYRITHRGFAMLRLC
jgi:hypothetical protein